MFKIIMLIKKRPELSDAEFWEHWRAHSAKVLAQREVLGIRHYSKTRPEPAASQRPTQAFGYDAMGELWYASREDFLRARQTPAGRAALAELRADEQRFVDWENSVLWFGHEERLL